MLKLIYKLYTNFFYKKFLKKTNDLSLMFFLFFSRDGNNHPSHSICYFIAAAAATLVFTWYYKETITNFWKSWWNKNKENLNSTNKATSEEPKVNVEQSEVAVTTDNISETISKKWYDYPMDKIQVLRITKENRMIPQGTLEFNNKSENTAVAKIVNVLNKRITAIIIKKNENETIHIDNAYDLKNNKQIIDLTKKLCTSTNKSYQSARDTIKNFIELNKNKEIGLIVDLKEPLLIKQKEHTSFELDPIESYEEILNKTVDSSEIFINVTKIGLYEQLLSKSMILLYYNSYYFSTGLTRVIDSKEYINILYINVGNKQNKFKLSDIAANKQKAVYHINCELHDHFFEKGDNLKSYIEKYANYEKCKQYYFSHYYSKLNLFFSENQQIDLFNTLITKEYLEEIKLNEVPCLDSLLDEIERLNSQKKNVLFVTETEIIPKNVPKLSSKTITDTILTDLYKLDSNDTEKTSLEKVKKIVSEEDFEKICDISTIFESTTYISYSNHIDKVNEILLSLIN